MICSIGLWRMDAPDGSNERKETDEGDQTNTNIKRHDDSSHQLTNTSLIYTAREGQSGKHLGALVFVRDTIEFGHICQHFRLY